MMDAYGQPDQYGRYPVSQSYGQDRNTPNYGQPGPPPPGHVRSGEYFVPMTCGFGQSGMIATSGPEQQYYGDSRGPQAPQGRGPNSGGYQEYPPQQNYAAAPPPSRDANHGRAPAPPQGGERRRRDR